jgi:signal transduction histidine kinase
LRNLAGFLDEILTIAKMEEGLLMLTSQPNDVSHLVANVVEGQREVAQLQGLQLKLDLPEERRLTCIDATLFKRVLDNLLSNAFKYAPDKSQITLRLRYLGNENGMSRTPSFRLQVMDQGPGIAPENYDRIFNKYEVVTLKQSGQEQVGLGLAFCKLVVEAHNGRIYVSPNRPQGAVFNVEM